MLLAKEKECGKIDWHSRHHLSSDAHTAAFAMKFGASVYERPEKSKR
jgi:hypothetical protein